jgi:hypothetical protein
MMGQINHDQGEFFYSFRLDEAVPDDHPVRAIAAVLDLSWVRSELASFYSKIGAPRASLQSYQGDEHHGHPAAHGRNPSIVKAGKSRSHRNPASSQAFAAKRFDAAKTRRRLVPFAAFGELHSRSETAVHHFFCSYPDLR